MIQTIRWAFACATLAASLAAQAQMPPAAPASTGGAPLAASPTVPASAPLPLSQRLILVRGPSLWGSFKLDRAGVTLVDSRYATGLDLAVAGSDRAVALAREAHSNLVTGAALTWSGLGVDLASLAAALVAIAYLPGNSPSTSATFNGALVASLGGVFVGLVLDLVGVPFQTSGMQKELDAVNAYNSDLVDGRLLPPALNALPGR